MSALAIGIITYKRPESLKRLLTALTTQTFMGRDPVPFSVIVVDNDSAASARKVCEDARTTLHLDLSYVVEPQQGIPFARNRVLASLPDDCTLLAWIDDDEAPLPQWIDALTAIQTETEADVVMGAVEAVLPEGAPAWISKGGFFNRRRFVDRATLSEGATNNCLIRVAAFRDNALKFDEKLRFTGGSDTLFFRRAASLGLRIVWSSSAVVQDFIPMERCNLRWLMRRNFRAGTTLAMSDIETVGVMGWLRRFYYGVSKILQGILNLPIGYEGKHELARALLMLARGSGMIAGLFGVRYEEFTPKKLMVSQE